MASIRPQEASSSTPPCSYQVFLSFRGEDTRKTFTDHLYTLLGYAGFRTFIDNNMERGEHIKSELQKAIQESRMSIVVLSKNYASSSWCLDELLMILERRRTSGHEVLPVFYDVDPSEVRKQSGCFEEAFTRHEGKVEAESGERRKEWMSKVGKWREALTEVANIAGMSLQDCADGHESRFIQKIVNVVGDKLSRTILDITPYVIIPSRAKEIQEIQFWLEDRSFDVGIAAICGMGGIGKTTIAKFLYNLNFSRFEGSSFLAKAREASKQPDGLLRLQRQLLSDMLKGRKEKIYNVDEGIVKIKDALSFKRVLVVLDDVDKLDQLDAVLGMHDWLFPGSKIIITTRHERLLRAHEACKVYTVKELDYGESLELFSLYAFGQSHPIDDYADASKLVIQHCGGLPLAIKVLGSSLSGKSLGVWKSQLEKLKAIPYSEIVEKLKISYDSLQDDHDKDLFLHLACFFVGRDKDYVVTILNGCEFYTEVGIQNLIDRCLVTVDEFNKVAMHHLLEEMGREIVRQESPKEPGERSRLSNHKDSFKVLRNNTGTSKIEGLILDMSIVEQNRYSRRVLGVNRNCSLKELFDNCLLNVGKLLKRFCLDIFSRDSAGIAPSDSNQMVLETDAFEKLRNLKLLQLGYVEIRGSFKKFPKEIRWLCWHGFPFESIPSDFPLETVVVLEMPHSSLGNFLDGTKFFVSLKILNLSHSHSLVKSPNFIVLPHLERLVLEDCTRLVEIHESVGQLERLVLLNLKDCSNLRKLPRSIGMLKSLGTLDISGCLNLENLPNEMRNMDSLTVLRADNVTGIIQSPCTYQDVKAWYSFILPSPLKLRKNPETSWASSLPRYLVKLSLVHCNLTDDALHTDHLSNLSSLQELNLSGNPISTLPNCIIGLNGLKSLRLDFCPRLRSIVVQQELETLSFRNCSLLEKLTFPAPAFTKLSTRHRQRLLKKETFLFPAFSSECDVFTTGWIGPRRCGGSAILVEYSGRFKLEPIGNVDEEIINNLGLFHLGSLRDLDVMLLVPFSSSALRKKLPLQGCHEEHVFYTYIPRSKVPDWFNLRIKGSSVSFTVPHHDGRIQGLSLCIVYSLSFNYGQNGFSRSDFSLTSVISNTTKRLAWCHRPEVTGLPEAGEDMVWLSYWKFENQVEAGDEVSISVVTVEERLKVKEVGVRLLYEVEKAPKFTQQILSASEVEQQPSEEIYRYGLPVPGNASSYQEKTQVFCLGNRQDIIRTLQCGRAIFF